MSLVLSRRHDKTPWSDLTVATLAALVIPAILGAVLLGCFYLGKAALSAELALSLWLAGMTLLLSPMLAVAGMILAVPVASYLIRLGWFGWVSAGATGLAVGGLMSVLMDYAIAAPFGMISIVILRAVLGRLRPMSPAA